MAIWPVRSFAFLTSHGASAPDGVELLHVGGHVDHVHRLEDHVAQGRHQLLLPHHPDDAGAPGEGEFVQSLADGGGALGYDDLRDALLGGLDDGEHLGGGGQVRDDDALDAEALEPRHLFGLVEDGDDVLEVLVGLAVQDGLVRVPVVAQDDQEGLGLGDARLEQRPLVGGIAHHHTYIAQLSP
jgi:hypothetical protein